MAELGAAASVVGIAVPALHGARLLLDDVQRIKGASQGHYRFENRAALPRDGI